MHFEGKKVCLTSKLYWVNSSFLLASFIRWKICLMSWEKKCICRQNQMYWGVGKHIKQWATDMYQRQLWSSCQLAYAMFHGNELLSICSCASPLMFVPLGSQLLSCCWTMAIQIWWGQSQHGRLDQKTGKGNRVAHIIVSYGNPLWNIS